MGPPLEGTQAINPKAMLSLNTYFGFNWDDVNLYQQRLAKLILGRPWLAARYLPHVFRWLDIAPALDPAVTLTSACLGYWLRQNGPTSLLSREGGLNSPPMPVVACGSFCLVLDSGSVLLLVFCWFFLVCVGRYAYLTGGCAFLPCAC